MSKPTDLLTALTLLRSLIQADNPPIEYDGICSWLNYNAVISTHAFVDLCHQWPKCIVHTNKDGITFKATAYTIVDFVTYSMDAHNNTQWSNPTRLEFIDWAIKHLSQEQSK